MKKQGPIFKIIIHAAVLLIATAVGSTARAEGTEDFGDFDNDGLDDMAAVTSPMTITVTLTNLNGSYTVSAILSVPKNRTIANVYVRDVDGDGVLDVYANSLANGGWLYYYTWLGNGDGTFGSCMTSKLAWPPKGKQHGSW